MCVCVCVCVCVSAVYKSWEPDRPGDYISYGGTKYLWVLRMELAPGLPSGAWNFEVVSRFLENLCAPNLRT
jgi:hypothetical protein